MYDDLDDYMDTGISAQHIIAREMTNPTIPIDVEFYPGQKEEAYYYNYLTKGNVYLSTVRYDPIDFFCQRTNCPYCLRREGDPFWKEASEELKDETIAYLKKLRKIMKISLLNKMIMTNMPDAS